MPDKLPNFIIAGVNKAGTTSVFQYLNAHPQVCGSRDKETGYFLPPRYGMKLEPLEIYFEQFRDCRDEKIIMEATPGYFYGGLQLASAMNSVAQKNCKVFIMLREPVSRLVSFYRAKKKSLELDPDIDFKKYIHLCTTMTDEKIKLRENNHFTGIVCGLYADHIEDWFMVFEERLKISFYDDLKSDPKKFTKDLCEWLELDASIYDHYNFEIENVTFAYKKRWMQKIAMGINKNTARFWRKNPKFKKWIRKKYFKVNRSEKEDVIDPEILQQLSQKYKPYNEKLRMILLKKGIKNLPAWLAG